MIIHIQVKLHSTCKTLFDVVEQKKRMLPTESAPSLEPTEEEQVPESNHPKTFGKSNFKTLILFFNIIM